MKLLSRLANPFVSFLAAQSPGQNDRFHAQIDLDAVWDATLKPSAAASILARAQSTRERERQQQHHQTAPPAGYPQKVITSEFKPQNFSLSPQLASSTSSADAKSHHRQTSIVHGIQHSRNGSYASASNSPLSPQIIAEAGGGRADAFDFEMGDSSTFASALSNMSSGSSFSSNTTIVPERPPPQTSENSGGNSGYRRVERMRSGNSSRDYRHQKSNSRHHKDELKTVGEYALHVLFTSVSLAFGDHKSYCSNNISVHCPSGREDQSMHHCTTRSRTTNRADMRTRRRPYIRTTDLGTGAHCKPKTKATDRFYDAMEENQE